MNTDKSNVCRIYIRTQIMKNKKKMWSAILQYKANYVNTEHIDIPQEYLIGKHRSDLYAIYDCVCRYVPIASTIYIYIENEQIVFEWNEEHKKDHAFCKSTRDQDLWQKLLYMAKRKRINIEIFGEKSVLTGITSLLTEEEW